MNDAVPGKLLRIFVDENDRHGDRPLYMAIVERMRAAGFPGATVLKGIAGYGVHRELHNARIVDFASNLPILIEALAPDDELLVFLPTLREMIPEGAIALEEVQILRLGASKGQA